MIQNGVASHHLSYARESLLLCILGYFIKFNEVKPDLHAVLFLLQSSNQFYAIKKKYGIPSRDRMNDISKETERVSLLFKGR